MLVADEDEPVVHLADFRPAPPIGDPVYANTLDCRPGEVHEFAHPRAESAIDAALADGVKLEHLAQAIAAKRRTCWHQRTTIDRTRRTLRCNDCGADVDPFDRMVSIAEGNTRLLKQIVDRDRLERQIQTLRAEVERLKADEKRSKARATAAKKARTNAQRLTDFEVYELGLWRDHYDARAAKDPREAKRLAALLTKLQDQRREAEAAEVEPEPPFPATPVSIAGGPDG